MVGIDDADRLEQRRGTDRCELSGENWLVPRPWDEGGRCHVVDLVRATGLERMDERELIENVGLEQREPVADGDEIREGLRRGAPHNAEDLVPVVEQQLREQRAVLPGDADDQRAS